MADKGVLFSKAFRGYKKRDVHEYIAEENRFFSQKEAAFEEEKRRLEATVAERDEIIRSLNSKIASLESESGGKDEKLVESEGAVAQIRAELELSERARTDDAKRFEEELVADRVAHEAELARVREECRVKLEEHDAELENIRQEYRLKEERRYEAIVSAAYRLRDKMAAELRTLTKRCLREVMNGVDAMRSDADQTTQNAEKHCQRMNRSIDTYEEQMKTEVRRILDEFKTGNFPGEDR